MSKEECENCGYSFDWKEETCEWVAFTLTTGACRRYPPKVSIDKDGSKITSLPRIYKTEWCGEYKAKTESEMQ